MITSFLKQRFVLLGDPSFRNYFIRMFCNRASDGIIFIVTAWLLLKLSGQASAVAVQLTLTLLPSALLSPIVGVWADRLRRKTIVSAADLLQGTLILITVILLLLSFKNIWFLYGMSIAVGISTLFHQVAAKALLREIVKKEELLLGSSTVSIISQVGSLFGSIFGGLIAFHFGEITAFALAGLLSIIGAISISHIVGKNIDQKLSSRGVIGFMSDYWDGFKAIQLNVTARRMFIGCLFFYASIPLLNFMLPILLFKQFHLTVSMFGTIEALFGVGGIISGLAIHHVEKCYGRRHIMIIGIFIFGVMFTLMPIFNNFIWLGFIYFLIGFFFQSGITLMSSLQASLSQEVQGRIFALYGSLLSILSTILIQLASLIFGSGDISHAYWLYGFAIMGFAAVVLKKWMEPPYSDWQEEITETAK